jgi:polyphosphate kinase
VGRDLLKLFPYLTGAGQAPKTEKLAIAPFDLRESLMGQIQRMMVAAKRGEPALIFLKMNHLVDQKMIHALYEASQAGVRVECLIRGICCLRPGIAGISENIQVKSTVGRFLEHQRVFCFKTNERDTMFLSSGDWMPRNFNRRIELMFPVEDKAARACIQDWMRLNWQDENRTRILDGKGQYRMLKRGQKALDAQACLGEGK